MITPSMQMEEAHKLNKKIVISLIVSIALIAVMVLGYTKNLVTFETVETEKSHGLPPIESITQKSNLESIDKHFSTKDTIFRVNQDMYIDIPLQSVLEMNNGDHVFLVYDSSKEAKVADAELLIEIIPMDQLIFDPDQNKEYITSINGYTAYVNEKAACGWDEYQEKYGVYSIVIDILIEDYNYWIRAAPTMSLEEAMEIAYAITN